MKKLMFVALSSLTLIACGDATDSDDQFRLEIVESEDLGAFTRHIVEMDGERRDVLRYDDADTVLLTDPATGTSVLASSAEGLLVTDADGELQPGSDLDPLDLDLLSAIEQGALDEDADFRQRPRSLGACEYQCDVLEYVGIINGYSFDTSGCYAGCAICFGAY